MKSILYIFLNLFIISVLMLFGNGMTPTPGSSSGNGNPAILLIVPLFILYIILVSQFYKVIKNRFNKLIQNTIVLILLIGHLMAGFYYQSFKIEQYREQLSTTFVQKNGYLDTEYINSITSSLLSIHMNNQFFNFNTFFMLISFSLITSLVINIVFTLNRKSFH